MPLSQEPLHLDASPRSVQEARHWVTLVLRRLERDDLLDSSELGVSELVTNALLHAEPPLSVRVRGTREHPRIEVSDGSRQPPVPPDEESGLSLDFGLPLDLDIDEDPELDGDFTLSTLGRGLNIVSMCSSSWGADIRPDGKVVWFEPTRDAHAAPSEAAVFTAIEELPDAAPLGDTSTKVRIIGVPVSLYAGFRRHFRELRRELRLLSMAHGDEYPLARDLSELLTDFEAHLGQRIGTDVIDTSRSQASDTIDLEINVPASTPTVIRRMLELLDLADSFCRAERLLSLARTPLQQVFQRWFLREFMRQTRGLDPVPWPETAPWPDLNVS